MATQPKNYLTKIQKIINHVYTRKHIQKEMQEEM